MMDNVKIDRRVSVLQKKKRKNRQNFDRNIWLPCVKISGHS